VNWGFSLVLVEPRNSFAEESRSLLKQLPNGRGYILDSSPAATDPVGVDFDASGHMSAALLERIGVPRTSDFYLCGPSGFLQSMREGFRNWGVLSENVHIEIFGALESITPGVAQVDHTPHQPPGPPRLGPSQSHSRAAG
jgi:ferredoxin-NADP reductase